MSLRNYRVGAVVAVSDMELARDFYEKKLGLDGARRRSAPAGARISAAGRQRSMSFPPRTVWKSHVTVAGGS